MRLVVAVDFSYYGEGSGVGVAVFRGRVLEDVRSLARWSYTHAKEVGDEERALSLALYGFHVREHRGAALWWKLPGLRGVDLYAVPGPNRQRLMSLFDEISKAGDIRICLVDRLSGDERSFLEPVILRMRARGLRVLEGKNYLVSLSDVAAYYAALLHYRQILHIKGVQHHSVERSLQWVRRFVGRKINIY